LFHKGLFPLRPDISILTFNYDPYLPYLLAKAYRIRCKVAGTKEDANVADAITSGFSSRNVGALEDGEDLCVLQLHGSIAWPCIRNGEHSIWHYDLFGTSVRERVEKLCFSEASNAVPPVLFPWEAINDQGTLLDQKEFCLDDGPDRVCDRQGGYIGPIKLHQLFVSIWKRARIEVNFATKISFIGLSMHDFLNPAFLFLFSQRKADVELVCANKDHQKFGGLARERESTPSS